MTEKMMDIRKIARVQLFIIPIFILLKFIRPAILESESPEFFKIVLLSIPNFFEAVVGTLNLTGVGLIINDKLNIKHQLRPKIIYIIAVILAGLYVSTQELKIHNLGGNNVFDRNDLIFSFIGLIIGYSIIIWLKPIIKKTENKTQTE